MKIVRLIRNVGDHAYATSHAAAERLAAGPGTGIGCSISACSMWMLTRARSAISP